MKLLLFIIGLGCGSVGAFYGYPFVGPRLFASLGDDDLLPLAKPTDMSEKAAEVALAPLPSEKSPPDPTSKPEARAEPSPETTRRPAVVAHAPVLADRVRPIDKETEDRLRAGRRFFRASEFAKAASEFEAVLKISPNNPSALRDLGATYAQMGQGEKAIVEYRAFLKVVKRGKDADAVRRVLAAAGVKP